MTEHEILQDLSDWYWSSGIERRGKHELSRDWAHALIQVEAHKQTIAAPSKAVVLYNTSSLADADLIARLLGDAAKGYGKDADGAIFRNSSAAGCGIALRFSLIAPDGDGNEDLLALRLHTPLDILKNCAAGYAMMPLLNGHSAPLSLGDIEANLLDQASDAPVSRAALEKVSRFVETMSVLVDSGLPRFSELATDNMWGQTAKPSILSARALSSEPRLSDSLTASLCWDKHTGISELYEALLEMLARLPGEGELFVEPSAETVLTRPVREIVALGKRIDRRDPAAVKALEDKVQRLALRNEGGRTVLSVGDEASGDICRNLSDLLLLQSLISEIVVPVGEQSAVLESNVLKDAFAMGDLIVAPRPDQRPAQPIDDISDVRILAAQVYRSGKAFGYCLTEAPENVSSITLVDAAEELGLSKLPQVRLGGQHHCALVGLDTVLLDEDAKTQISADLTGLPGQVFGMAGDKQALLSLTADAQDEASDRIELQKGLGPLLNDVDSVRTLLTGLVQADGGLGLAFGTATTALGDQGSQTSTGDLREKLARLVSVARPNSGVSAEDHQRIFIELATRLRKACLSGERLSDRRNAALKISELIRRAFCVDANDLDPLPKQLGADHDRATAYLSDQLRKWASKSNLDACFDAVNFPQQDRPQVVRAMEMHVPIEEIAVWMINEFGDITANRQAMHARAYVATRLTEHLAGNLGRNFDQKLNTVKLQAQLNAWANPTIGVEDSLHFQTVILPFSSRLEGIAKTPPNLSSETLPGDEQINEIAARIGELSDDN